MNAQPRIACALAGSVLVIVSHALYAQRPGQVERLPPQAPPATLACIGCHGAHGQGNAASGTPRIAGQSAHYLAKQLESYADGSRRNRVMEPIARSLPPEVRAEVARYYAQATPPVEASQHKARVPERGRVLATLGDEALGVQACRNCHGPEGAGEPPNIPYLAGLDAGYLGAALNAWKVGTRTNDAGLQMFTVVSALPSSDITALAQYYASLPPPGPAPLDIVRAPPPRKAVPAETPTAQPGAAGRGRAGVEQGAPAGGATQGKGAADVSEKPPAAGASEPAAPAKRAPDTDSDEEQRKRPPAPGVDPRSGTESETGDPARGRALVASGAYGCSACHAIPGIRAPRGVVGPPLAGIASRAFIAGQLPNTREVLITFLRNPPKLVPQTGMPNVGLSLEDARNVAAYLRSMEQPGAR